MQVDTFGGLVSCTRFAAGYTVNGRSVPGAPIPFTIYAVIEPLAGRELLILPEGERSKESVKIYTDTRLQTINETGMIKADRVSWQGRQFEVRNVKIWSDGEDTFYQAVCVLIELDTTEVNKMQTVITPYQVQVGQTSSQIIAANANRKYLRLDNHDSELAVIVKIGADFVTPADEVQKITFSAVPTSGSLTLLSSDGIQSTGPIAFNATPATFAASLQTAIRLLNGNFGGVTVTGDYTNGFTVDYAGDVAKTPQALLLVGANTLITNANEVQEVQEIIFDHVPSAGQWKITQGLLTTALMAFGASTTDIQNAFAAAGMPAVTVTGSYAAGLVFTFTTAAKLDLMTVSYNTLTYATAEQNCIQSIRGTSIPTEGTFALMFLGAQTATLNFDASAGQIQTALLALATVGSGNLTVAGTDIVTGFAVTFAGSLANAPQPLIQFIRIPETELLRYGAEVLVQIVTTQAGIGTVACVPTVTETTPGHGDDAITVAVVEVTAGVSDLHEGVPLSAGGTLEWAQAVPNGALYAKAEGNANVIVEINEGV